MVAGRPRHGAEALSSRVGLPASGGPAASPERGRERVDAPPLHFAEAQAEQELWEELRDHGASLNRALNEALRIHSGPAWRVFQELEIRTRDRYGALDQMSSELRRLQEQRDALDALVEALRTNDGWLAYRAEALRDHLLELEGRSTEGVSAVEKVRTALIDRDEALQRAREDLAGARTVAAEWEAEVASVRAQLQQDRAALEGARSWQSQAEEKAKEAEELKASLADKVAAVVTAEEQLRQERAALVEARAVLERERLAREKALGQLQQERVALEGARASLKEREDEVSKLDGELIALSISREDQRRSLEEQGATIVGLQQAVEGGRQALEAEKKQVEGLRTALGHATTQAEVVRAAYNSSQQELEELRATALETCQAVEEGEAQAGSSLASRLRALGGHVSRRMRRALHLGVQKALGVVVSHYLVDFEAVASGYVVPVGVEDEVAMERADALAAAAAETLAEDFTDFLFPDAPDAGEPQA